MPEIRIKRVYEPPEESDGVRILVDRVWPRGISKENARIDVWLKEIAPSAELCKWYGHSPARWPEFLRRYHKELEQNSEAVEKLLTLIGKGPVTLVFASSAQDKNNALALKLYLMKKIGGSRE